MTTDWDAIVIGAGPAGSVAARQLALGGRRVLLLDKKHFPRRKVCGACLNYSAVTLLNDIGLGEVLQTSDEADVTRLEIRAVTRRLSLPIPSGRAISRMRLDQALVEAAVRAGVTFQDGVTATVRASDRHSRSVETRNGHATNSSATNTLRAKIVLAADGLGHPSLSDLGEIRDHTARSSRIGAGCEVTEFPDEYVPGVIHMAVGRGGYVGLVRVEDGALNVAGAFDPQFVRDSRGPALAADCVLKEAGFPAIPALAEAEWLGTPALSRSTTPVAAERLFVLGDASGYIEPFTGEGILWALASAVAVAPIVSTACDEWEPSLTAAWSREHSRIVRSRQRTCRMLAALLKSPTCVRLAMFLLPKMPSLLRPIVRGVSLPTPRCLTITRCG